MEIESLNWIHLALDYVQWRALVHRTVNIRVPYSVGNFFAISWSVVLRKDCSMNSMNSNPLVVLLREMHLCVDGTYTVVEFITVVLC